MARVYSDFGWTVVGTGTASAENAPLGSLNKYYPLLLPSSELDEIIQQIQPDICVHCAGRASVPLSVIQPAEDFKASVAGTFNLLEALRLNAPECHLIYLSSAAVYGNPKELPVREEASCKPISPYGFHKLICENLCKEFYEIYGLKTTIARIFSAYGPGLRRQVVWDVCNKILTQPSLNLQGTGKESRDFIHVRDVARAIYHISETSSSIGAIFNLGSGNETTIQDLVNLILKHLEKDKLIQFDNKVPVGSPVNWRADISKLNQIRFFAEVTLSQGVSVYSKWCQAEVIGW